MIAVVMDSRDQTREWLRAVLQHLQCTPTELARRAGVAATTLTRFLNDEEFAFDLSRRTIELVSRAAGVQPMQKPGSRIRGVASSEAQPYEKTPDLLLDGLVRKALDGRNGATPWVLRSRALENEGYMPGDVLIVSESEAPVPGDVVCAQVVDWRAGRDSTLFRVYEPPFILAASNDPKIRRPLPVDQENVRIIGVVISMLRTRRSAAA